MQPKATDDVLMPLTCTQDPVSPPVFANTPINIPNTVGMAALGVRSSGIIDRLITQLSRHAFAHSYIAISMLWQQEANAHQP